MEAKLIEPTCAEVFVQCCILKNQGKSGDYADAYAYLVIEENLTSPLGELFDNFKHSKAGLAVRTNYKDKLEKQLNDYVKMLLRNF